MNAIKHIRTEVLNVNQSEFARIAGVSQVTVSRWETGERDPGLQEITRIREAVIARGIVWQEEWLFQEGENHGKEIPARSGI